MLELVTAQENVEFLTTEITKLKKYIAEGQSSAEMQDLLKKYEADLAQVKKPKESKSKLKVQTFIAHNPNKTKKIVEDVKSVESENREPASKPPIFPLPVEVKTEEKKEVIDPFKGLTFSGLLDLYYSFNFNHPDQPQPLVSSTSTTFPGNNNIRYYDIFHNQAVVNLAELTIKKTTDEVNFLLDLDFGETADINTIVISGSGTSIDEMTKHIGQAYMTYSPKAVPGLVIDAGKMATHVGLEYIKAKDNWQYSRSTMFGYGGPFWHTGLHVAYDWIPTKLNTSLYIYNGWNSMTDNNSAKTLGAQLKWTPTDSSSFIYNVITGPEQNRNIKNNKTVHEFNFVYAFHPDLLIAFDTLYGEEENVTVTNSSGISSNADKAVWSGQSLSLKWKMTDKLFLSPRVEFYNDRQGYTLGGDPQKMVSLTLTTHYQVTDELSTRLEYRNDKSDLATRFNKADGQLTDQQSTVTWALLYSF